MPVTSLTTAILALSLAAAPPPDPDTAQRLYRERAIRVETVTQRNAQGMVTDSAAVPYEGRTVLSMEDMLSKVGRQDLAQQYAAALTAKGVLSVGGILVSIGGVAGLPFALAGACTAKSARTLQCVRSDYTWVAVFGATAGAGIVLWSIGYLFPLPVSPGAARSLADDYNDRLRRDLGLAAPPPGGTSMQLSLTPGGLALSGTF
jgi:hypothetical protein